MHIKVSIYISLLCLLFTQSASAGQAENISACVSKAKEFANVSLNEFSASYEGNWLSHSKVIWEDVHCEAKLGNVYNLTIKGKPYIYKGYAGKDSYELNQKLENEVSIAINKLELKIKILKQGIEILESKSSNISNYLKKKSSNHEEAKKYIHESIEKSTQFFIKPDSNTKKITTSEKKENKQTPVKIISYYVISNKLNVRLAPNKTGKVTNVLYKRQKVDVFEFNGDWARISDYFNGTTEGSSGKLARWVFTKHLSKNKPKDEKIKVDSPVAEAIKSSDDFTKYQKIFTSASQKLINNGTCSISNYKEVGGWVKSVKHKKKPIYFTYCGGYKSSNKIYLNIATSETFK